MLTLNNSQLKQLEEQLKQLRTKLSAQIELAKPAAATVTLDQTKVGRLSRMDAMQQQQMADSNLQQTRQRLQLVIKACNKILTEDYGYCELCDEPIAFARLQVNPEAGLCLKCQSQQEQ